MVCSTNLFDGITVTSTPASTLNCTGLRFTSAVMYYGSDSTSWVVTSPRKTSSSAGVIICWLHFDPPLPGGSLLDWSLMDMHTTAKCPIFPQELDFLPCARHRDLAWTTVWPHHSRNESLWVCPPPLFDWRAFSPFLFLARIGEFFSTLTLNTCLGLAAILFSTKKLSLALNNTSF